MENEDFYENAEEEKVEERKEISKYEQPKEKIVEYSNSIIANDNIVANNETIWNCYRDNVLKQLVIMFNFDFNAISKRFDELIGLDEDEPRLFGVNELRRHWGFLHSMRLLGKRVDEEFYIRASMQREERIKAAKAELYERNKPKEDTEEFLEKLFNRPVTEQMLKEYEKDLNSQSISSKETSFPLNITN